MNQSMKERQRSDQLQKTKTVKYRDNKFQILEDRVEEAKGIENRAVVDGVFRTSR